ncbi:MAG: RNA polymerase-associated protein RapA, partial [Verrucomicrobiota bacterium]
MSDEYVKGQRWMSEAEPELGLGLVVECEFRRVQVLFPSTGETRMYSSENAPLKRVQFQVGDQIHTHDDHSLTIESIEDCSGIFYYHCGEESVPEMQLADTIQLSSADRRLLDGRVDPSQLFDLRQEAWRQQSKLRSHPAFGYMGARMDLIPHQLYIAQEVASRTVPRVLLADEVGLGKTIEACLILHRLMVTGRAGRALILVPEPLVHQWFVELLRRFNLSCAIYDEERYASMESENPFLDEHLILTSLDLFRENPERLQQVLAADWGMVIVDEVHHLKWEPESSSWEYQVVEALSRISQGLLLLTGTPEQFGEAGHFARLRLLDPDRFHDYQQFCRETEGYHDTAQVVDKLILGQKPTPAEAKLVNTLFAGAPSLQPLVEEYLAGKASASACEQLIGDLLDRHGTGRVVFRNTRSAISGFPQRKVHGIALRAAQTVNDDTDYAALAEAEMRYELHDDQIEETPKLPRIGSKDPRIDWLVKFLKQNKDEKVLLICRYRERAMAIQEALLQRVNLKMTVFHEDLTLLQRDRNAAWFADSDGAQLLICSEIGSEGRNFQFAHHLVLFDLPVDPELLEQRIGRLDRIGQKHEIQLHVPYFKGSGGEVLFQWFHDGVDAFEHSVQGGALFLDQFGSELKTLLREPKQEGHTAKLKTLLQQTAAFRQDLQRRLEQGRDRLLELHSFRPEPAQELISAIREWDSADALEALMTEALDHYGIHIEELSEKRWLLTKGHLLQDELAVIPDEGKTVTLDRRQALERDDVEFLTWDHPLTASILDYLLGSETGNTAFVEVTAPEGMERGLYAELVFILEGSCPPEFDIQRFLPMTPIRVVCDQTGTVLQSDPISRLEQAAKTDVASHVLSSNTEVLKALLQPI